MSKDITKYFKYKYNSKFYQVNQIDFLNKKVTISNGVTIDLLEDNLSVNTWYKDINNNFVYDKDKLLYTETKSIRRTVVSRDKVIKDEYEDEDVDVIFSVSLRCYDDNEGYVDVSHYGYIAEHVNACGVKYHYTLPDCFDRFEMRVLDES